MLNGKHQHVSLHKNVTVELNTAYAVTRTCLLRHYNMPTCKHISEDCDHLQCLEVQRE